ncbi:hypothetical protein GH733_001787 [Mirounga leonina]|nr:hypothetical protein GH733_001787 [Mirounga leonina]
MPAMASVQPGSQITGDSGRLNGTLPWHPRPLPCIRSATKKIILPPNTEAPSICPVYRVSKAGVGEAASEDYSLQTVDIPEYVDITLKGCTVIVKGPRGTLWRTSKRINVDLSLLGRKKKRLQVDKWQRNSKELATIHTMCSHVQNMIKGVTLGFCYKMWSAYAHFSSMLLFRRMVLLLKSKNFLVGSEVSRTKRLLNRSPSLSPSNEGPGKEGKHPFPGSKQSGARRS